MANNGAFNFLIKFTSVYSNAGLSKSIMKAQQDSKKIGQASAKGIALGLGNPASNKEIKNYGNALSKFISNTANSTLRNETEALSKKTPKASRYDPGMAYAGGNRAMGLLFADNPIGKFMMSPAGQIISGAALVGQATAKMVQPIISRDESYRQIMSYMSGPDVFDNFNNDIRPTIEKFGRQYAISIGDLSNYVLEATKSGFSIDTLLPTIESAARVARAYNLSMNQVTELITTASYANWFDPDDPNSLNRFLNQLTATVSATKTSIPQIQEGLKYSQNVRAANISSADYFAMIGALSNFNIYGSRGGRVLDNMLGYILNPQGGSDVELGLEKLLQKEGIDIGSDKLKDLGAIFGAIKFSVYNENGELQIGEGKRYESMSHAITDLFTKFKNNDFSEAEMQKVKSLFGRIGSRGMSAFEEFAEELVPLLERIEEGSDTQAVLNIKMSGIAHASADVKSSLEDVTTAFLYLEESTGYVEGSMKLLSASIQGFANFLRLFEDPVQKQLREGGVTADKSLQDNMILYALALEQGIIDKDVKNITPEQFAKIRALEKSLDTSDTNKDTYAYVISDLMKKGELGTDISKFTKEDHNKIYKDYDSLQSSGGLNDAQRFEMFENPNRDNVYQHMGKFITDRKKILGDKALKTLNPNFVQDSLQYHHKDEIYESLDRQAFWQKQINANKKWFLPVDTYQQQLADEKKKMEILMGESTQNSPYRVPAEAILDAKNPFSLDYANEQRQQQEVQVTISLSPEAERGGLMIENVSTTNTNSGTPLSHNTNQKGGK